MAPVITTQPSIADVADGVARFEHALTGRLAAVLERSGCSVDAWRALRLLADGEGHAMRELVAAALLPPPSATRLVDGLVADNLAYRLVDERDRRRVLVHLTARGRRLHERVAAAVEAAADDILPASARAELAGLVDAA